MTDLFYRILSVISRRVGTWFFRLVAWFVASGYFFLFPRRVATSSRFYGALFPQRNRFYHLYCAWKQFHRFTRVFLDRILFAEGYPMQFVQEGWSYLEETVRSRTGAILLMSHLGCWELAAHQLLKKEIQGLPGMRLLLYMGKKGKEQIEARQKEDFAARGIRIVEVAQDGSAPVDIVEGVHFLKSGGLVSLTGDRRWREDQRCVAVRFLGHEALLPEGPFIFALLAQAPLLIFFAFRDGTGSVQCRMLPPLYVEAKNRKDRPKAIAEAAQTYADALEEAVRAHPWEWFHFEPFLGRRWEA